MDVPSSSTDPGLWELAAAPFARPDMDDFGNPRSVETTSAATLGASKDAPTKKKSLLSELLANKGVNMDNFRGKERYPFNFQEERVNLGYDPSCSSVDCKEDCFVPVASTEIIDHWLDMIADRPRTITALALEALEELHEFYPDDKKLLHKLLDRAARKLAAPSGSQNAITDESADYHEAARVEAMRQTAALYTAIGEFMWNTQVSSVKLEKHTKQPPDSNDDSCTTILSAVEHSSDANDDQQANVFAEMSPLELPPPILDVDSLDSEPLLTRLEGSSSEYSGDEDEVPAWVYDEDNLGDRSDSSIPVFTRAPATLRVVNNSPNLEADRKQFAGKFLVNNKANFCKAKAEEFFGERIDSKILPDDVHDLSGLRTEKKAVSPTRPVYKLAREASSSAAKGIHKVNTLRKRVSRTFGSKRNSWYSIDEMGALRKAGRPEGFYDNEDAA